MRSKSISISAHGAARAMRTSTLGKNLHYLKNRCATLRTVAYHRNSQFNIAFVQADVSIPQLFSESDSETNAKLSVLRVERVTAGEPSPGSASVGKAFACAADSSAEPIISFG